MKNISIKNLKKRTVTLVKYGQTHQRGSIDTTTGTDPTTTITSGTTTSSYVFNGDRWKK